VRGFVWRIIVRTPNALDALVTREQVRFSFKYSRRLKQSVG